MKRRSLFYGLLVIVAVITWIYSGNPESPEEYGSRSKIVLREVGDRLLRADNDTTSLVLPVRELDAGLYQLSFEKPLSMDPGLLVETFEKSLDNGGLTKNYIVEVYRMSDGEVAYSYEMNTGREKTIVACQGRVLPTDNYNIMARMLSEGKRTIELHWGYLAVLLLLIVVLDLFVFRKKKEIITNDQPETYVPVGSFRFFPEQNKLVKQAEEISLSRKECELLAIFVERPNEVIKREELSKKVWEDNGVVVGRSLDTYISKLRKKLQQDESVKLTNVHGVGYKLEL